MAINKEQAGQALTSAGLKPEMRVKENNQSYNPLMWIIG
jgi:hypothetical protein